MASLGHVAVGLVVGRLFARDDPPRLRRSMALFALLSLAPDADVVAFSLRIPYHHPLGHRGASHSLFVALALAAAGALLARVRGASAWRVFAAVAVAVGSHGPLDALTDGGLGAALLWPLSEQRFFFPWRPLPVAPIGLGFVSARGLVCLLVEFLWFSPLLLFALWPRRWRQVRAQGH